MKKKTFKPMLAPNEEINLEEIKYPLLASYKLDGIRCIFKDGEILSRSLKQIQNKQLRKKMEPLRKYCEENNIILDGEIYSLDLTFQEITGFVMTKDFEDPKTIKKHGEVLKIPEDLKFYCFDIMDKYTSYHNPFHQRIKNVGDIAVKFPDIMDRVNHERIQNPLMISELFDHALEDGFEGLILRDPNGRYKFGRGTVKEGLIYKVKPYRTFDAEIKGVVQATIVDPDAEKTKNELGRSVTSKKKEDRILIEKASAFWVKYEGKDLKVVLAMTDEEKKGVWKNQKDYIGKWIEYKGMMVGAKDVPRHPVMQRFRKDKDVA